LTFGGSIHADSPGPRDYLVDRRTMTPRLRLANSKAMPSGAVELTGNGLRPGNLSAISFSRGLLYGAHEFQKWSRGNLFIAGYRVVAAIVLRDAQGELQAVGLPASRRERAGEIGKIRHSNEFFQAFGRGGRQCVCVNSHGRRQNSGKTAAASQCEMHGGKIPADLFEDTHLLPG
jgi:hypothetical protein